MARTYRLGLVRRLSNRWVSLFARVGVVPSGVYILTTQGRRSGLERSTPVNLVERDGVRWLVAPYGEVPWVLNARAAGRVTLTRGRDSREHVVTEVDPHEAAPVLREYLRKVPIVKSFFDVSGGDSDEAFAAEAPRHPVFRIEG